MLVKLGNLSETIEILFMRIIDCGRCFFMVCGRIEMLLLWFVSCYEHYTNMVIKFIYGWHCINIIIMDVYYNMYDSIVKNKINM